MVLLRHWKKLLVTTGLGLSALLLAGIGYFYASVLEPLWRLPRPLEEIEADWAAIEPDLPTDFSAGPIRKDILGYLENGDLDAIAAWLDSGETLELRGCSLKQSLDEEPHYGVFEIFEAAKGFLARGDEPHALVLVEALSTGDVMAVAVATAVMKEMPSKARDSPIDVDVLYQALAMEAACADALLASTAKDLDAMQGLLIDMDVERARLHDTHARLLLAVRSHHDDPLAIAAALDGMSREPRAYSPLAGLLTFGAVTIGGDLARDLRLPSFTGGFPSQRCEMTHGNLPTWRLIVDEHAVELFDLGAQQSQIDEISRTWAVHPTSPPRSLMALLPALDQIALDHGLRGDAGAILLADRGAAEADPSFMEALGARGWGLGTPGDLQPDADAGFEVLHQGEALGVLRFVDPTRPSPLGPQDIAVFSGVVDHLPDVAAVVTLDEQPLLGRPRQLARAHGIPWVRVDHVAVLGAWDGDMVRLSATDELTVVPASAVEPTRPPALPLTMTEPPDRSVSWFDLAGTTPAPQVGRHGHDLSKVATACEEATMPTKALGFQGYLQHIEGGLATDIRNPSVPASHIRAQIVARPLEPTLLHEFQELLDSHGRGAPIRLIGSTRSGILLPPVACDPSQAEGCLQQVFAKLWTDEAVWERSVHGIDRSEDAVAVLIQRAISEPIARGVLSTESREGALTVLVNAKPGLLPFDPPMSSAPEAISFPLGKGHDAVRSGWTEHDVFLGGPAEDLLLELDDAVTCALDALAADAIRLRFTVDADRIWLTEVSDASLHP